MQISKAFKSLPKTYWIANTMELFERWAWYGFFIVFSLYLTGSKENHGLEFSQEQKGWIMGIGSMLLYLLPVITGTISDKIGYKKTLIIAYMVYIFSFIALPQFHQFGLVFACFILLATGGAIFKPIVSATVAKTTNKDNASIGFGIFYMIVNIGAFIGPFFSSKLKEESWSYVFYFSALVISINLILLLFYKEPQIGKEKSEHSLAKTIAIAIRHILVPLKDLKFLLFLLIISGFWTMYNQLFFTLPVFVEQWVDTSIAYNSLHSILPGLAEKVGEAGRIPAEILINVDAGFIILFQLIVSSIVMKFKPLNAMVSGFVVATLGMGLTLLTQNSLFTVLAIFIFALGEMASSPKITEYIGSIAPKKNVALYMGCSFIPVAIGNFFAGIISGNVYGSMSDKFTLAKRAASENGISIKDNLSNDQTIHQIAEKMNMNDLQFTNYLWHKYSPDHIWLIIVGIGTIATICLFSYDKILSRKQKSSKMQ